METFGCQMNEYDTEIVRSLLKARGFQFTLHDDEADVILFNTCAIRENAHNRVYGHLARYTNRKKERGLVIGVLGYPSLMCWSVLMGIGDCLIF